MYVLTIKQKREGSYYPESIECRCRTLSKLYSIVETIETSSTEGIEYSITKAAEKSEQEGEEV